MANPVYLYLDLLTLAFPFLLSFDRKVAFYRQWKYFFPAVFVMGAFFIAKDVLFAASGIWGFNDRYLLGIRWFGLPVEEWMFFVVVPYAIVFIYACLMAYLRFDPLLKVHRPVLFVLSFLLIVVAVIWYDRLYTSVIFMLTAILLLYNLYMRKPWLSMFLLAYLVSMLPFLLVNGVLTGSFLDEPIVWYNNSHNLGIRLFTIPVEDTIYSLMMFLMTVQLMEWFRARY
ncbi:MAG TPA: lycopene cyclase domain-containing protein [Bacteroidales bacterium]|nr:lycopene cyclase domain-containing protein [Bacteroidales bacterium]